MLTIRKRRGGIYHVRGTVRVGGTTRIVNEQARDLIAERMLKRTGRSSKPCRTVPRRRGRLQGRFCARRPRR
jgi:hypothetical protein